jgi:hypothetical protein
MWTLSFRRKLVSFIRTQVVDGADPNSFFGAYGIGGGNLRQVAGPDLLADENQVYRGACAGLVRIYQHVDSVRVPMPEASLFRRGNDSG